MPFQSADDYTLSHLAEHLAKSAKYARLQSLLTDNAGWLHVKFERLNSDVSFLSDVDIAIACLDEMSSTPISQLIPLFTLRHIVGYRTRRHTNTDLNTLVWMGRIDEALGYARLQTNPYEKFSALKEIVQTCVQLDIFDEDLLTELRDIAISIPNAYERATAVCWLIALLQQLSRPDLISPLWQSITAGIDAISLQTEKNEAVGLYSLTLALTGNIAMAEKQIPFLAGSLWQTEAMSAIGIGYAQSGNTDRARDYFAEAWQLSAQIDDALSRCGVRCDLLVNYAAYLDQIISYFTLLLEEADEVENPGIKVHMVSLVASGLAKVGEFAHAQRLVEVIRHEWTRSITLKDIAIALGEAKRMVDALELTNMITRHDIQADVFRSLAAISAQQGQISQALELYEQAQMLLSTVGNASARKRVQVFCAFAPLLVRRGYVDDATNFLNKAQEAADSIDKIERDARISYYAIIDALVKTEHVAWAESLVNIGSTEKEWGSAPRGYFAGVLATAGRFEEAREIIDGLRFPAERAAAYCKLAVAYLENEALAEAESALQIAMDTEAEADQTRVMVSKLSQEGKLGAFPNLVQKVDSARGDIVIALTKFALHAAQTSTAIATQLLQKAVEFVSDASYTQFVAQSVPILINTLVQFNKVSAAQQVVDSWRHIHMGSAADEESDEVYVILAMSLAELGQMEEAQSILARIRSDSSRSEAVQGLVRIGFSTGNGRMALELLSHFDLNEFLCSIAIWCRDTLGESQSNDHFSIDDLLTVMQIASWERGDLALNRS